MINKMLTRTLSLFMALVMTVSLSGVSAFADGTQDAQTTAAPGSVATPGDLSGQVNPMAVPAADQVVFKTDSKINLQKPTDLVITTDDHAIVAAGGYRFDGVFFSKPPSTAGTNLPDPTPGISYSNGVLTIKASTFSQHMGRYPLTAGQYEVEIYFSNGTAAEDFSRKVKFEMTNVVDPGSDARFTFNANYEDLEAVMLDDRDLVPKVDINSKSAHLNGFGYGPGPLGRVEDGSINVILFSSFLRTLPGKIYKLSIRLKDGTVLSLEFEIPGSRNPRQNEDFRFQGDYTKLEKIFLNGIELKRTTPGASPTDLTGYGAYSDPNGPALGFAKDGSVIVTLYAHFLNTLSGPYTLTVLFAGNVSVDQNFYIPPRQASSGGSSGGGSFTTKASSPITGGQVVCNTVPVPFSALDGSFTSSISSQALRSIVDNAFEDEDGGKTVQISYDGIPAFPNFDSLTLTFNASGLKPDEKITFIIETPFGIFIFTTEQMLSWFDGGFGTYTITLRKSSLELDVKKGGKSVARSATAPIARIGVEYIPKKGEINPAVVDGKDRVLTTSVYEKGMVYADIFARGTYKAAPQATAFERTEGTGFAEGWSNDNKDLKKLVYYNRNGKRLTGWQTIDGDRYYFDKNGIMLTGRQTISDKTYRFSSEGKMISGE